MYASIYVCVTSMCVTTQGRAGSKDIWWQVVANIRVAKCHLYAHTHTCTHWAKCLAEGSSVYCMCVYINCTHHTHTYTHTHTHTQGLPGQEAARAVVASIRAAKDDLKGSSLEQMQSVQTSSSTSPSPSRMPEDAKAGLNLNHDLNPIA